jgi:hypothetical protein
LTLYILSFHKIDALVMHASIFTITSKWDSHNSTPIIFHLLRYYLSRINWKSMLFLFYFIFEMGSPYAAQDSLELLHTRKHLTLASQVAGNTNVHHQCLTKNHILFLFFSFFQTGAKLTPWATPPALFCDGFFEIESLELFVWAGFEL